MRGCICKAVGSACQHRDLDLCIIYAVGVADSFEQIPSEPAGSSGQENVGTPQLSPHLWCTLVCGTKISGKYRIHS